jgi:transcriptional regulator with XRE-family HTH domain
MSERESIVALDLGARLRQERESQNLSLRSVATAVGVSASLLSQVETGKTTPSVSTLFALVSHLGLSLDTVMGHTPGEGISLGVLATADITESAGGSNSVVQRSKDNPSIGMENGVTWERLAMGHQTAVSPVLVTYDPGGSSSVEGKLMRHDAVEYGFIIEGSLTLKLEFETYELHAGDSLCFDGNRPHMYFNDTNKPTKGIWFVVSRQDDTYETVSRAVPDFQSTGRISSAVDVLNAMKNID